MSAALNPQTEYQRWKQRALEDPDLPPELAAMEGDAARIALAFGGALAFGTGGLRGIIGAGPAHMNLYTVRRATQGLANYLKDTHAAGAVAIAYDSRLKSAYFARQAAEVLAANGITAHLFPRLMPTPCLSFAVRALRCDAGICITASHNPAVYNGYKVYGPDGGQITTQAAAAVGREISALDYFDGPPAGQNALIHTIGEDVVNTYIDAVLKASGFGGDEAQSEMRVVYTPLNGAGCEMVPRALEAAGLGRPILVEAQAKPDGNFPSCPLPNPENPEALALAIETADAQNADLVLATDPDCDRLGVAVKEAGEWKRLSGNEVGVLFLNYICKERLAHGTMPHRPVAVSTVVSSDMALLLCEKYGVELRRTLTGFKYIGEQIGLLEAEGGAGRFIFGFEESCGYLSGSYVRDKDGVNAALLVTRMARRHAAKGLSLAGAMEALYAEHGYYLNALHSLDLAPGADALGLLDKLHVRGVPSRGGAPVAQVVDYEKDQTGLPKAPMLEYRLADGCKVFVRPSGTEPKVKFYLFAKGQSRREAEGKLAALWQDIGCICDECD